jgi:hypothetical protein
MSGHKNSQQCSICRVCMLVILAISLLLCYRNLIAMDVITLTTTINEWAVRTTSSPIHDDDAVPTLWNPPPPPEIPPTRIAYAVSVTSCNKPQLVMDGASVLQHSIHINSIRNPKSGSRYDYDMIAFVHTEATSCIQILRDLQYKIFLKKVPIQIDQIRGNYRRWANTTGCCGDKEWLKLYAYTMTKYPIVVHLDLDCLILKPMDDLFDAMIFPTVENHDAWITARQRIPAMWIKSDELPNKIDAFFTRDYGMIQMPGRRKPHQIGVQGGFLVVRPNMTDFKQYIEIILEGNYTETQGWGEGLKYGGYYGAGTIQGLAAMFYSHLHPERAVELNRCIYNNMADAPYPKKYDTKQFSHMKPYPCISLQEVCEDCRKTPIDDIASIHLTNCLKPWHCHPPSRVPLLCVQHWYEWYRMRYLFEAKRRNEQVNAPRIYVDRTMNIQNISFGYCSANGALNYHSINESMPKLQL